MSDRQSADATVRPKASCRCSESVMNIKPLAIVAIAKNVAAFMAACRDV